MKLQSTLSTFISSDTCALLLQDYKHRGGKRVIKGRDGPRSGTYYTDWEKLAFSYMLLNKHFQRNLQKA